MVFKDSIMSHTFSGCICPENYISVWSMAVCEVFESVLNPTALISMLSNFVEL